MTADPEPFEFVPRESISIDEQVALLSDSFDRPVDPDWYRWKHVEGAWGPSHGVVTLDADGPAAIFLWLPWGVRHEDDTLTLTRGLDCGTLPRARRRGLFKIMDGMWIDDQRAAHQPFTFCTANETAAKTHAKLGASVRHIAHAYSLSVPVRTGRGRITPVSITDAAAAYAPPPPDRSLSTAWTPESLAWRFDPRSGHDYRAALLDQADASTGMIYRVETRRHLRFLLCLLSWGEPKARARLLASAAGAERAVMTLELDPLARRPVLRRGQSLLCTWDLDAPPAPSASADSDAHRWNPTFADLEGVI